MPLPETVEATEPARNGATERPTASTNSPAVTVPLPGSRPTNQSALEAPPVLHAPPRRFTQRIMQDGEEVDAGPAASSSNWSQEGVSKSEMSSESVPHTGYGVRNDNVGKLPNTARKAIFYEEKTDKEPGTQQSGNVKWSTVNEPPSVNQPPEPAIRALVDVPDVQLKLTMTIRRNADASLPASHVIELMFDAPSDFPGAKVANVQRIALKPTEEARGEPLVGVAGKIMDGFFIIALNNLAAVKKTNIELMRKEDWIDIPIAYSTGRRALISMEKGPEGDRVFENALNAWAAKT